MSTPSRPTQLIPDLSAGTPKLPLIFPTPSLSLPSSPVFSDLPLLCPQVWSWDEGFLAKGSQGRFLVETFPAPEGRGGQGPGLISVLHISGTQESDFSRGFNCSARNRLGEGGTLVSLGRRGETLGLKTPNLRSQTPKTPQSLNLGPTNAETLKP